MEERRAQPAGVLDTEDSVKRRAPEIRVDEAHARAALGGHHPEVRDRGGFSLARGRGGKQDASRRLIQSCELDVGAEHPVGLRGGRLRLDLGDEDREAPYVPLPRGLGHYRLVSNPGTIAMTGSPR